MSAYSLTHAEAWSLCTLLHLPVQSGSALAGWLHSAATPVSPQMLEESMASLQHKGYYDPTRAEQPFLEGFISSLGLACLNAAEVTTIIRRSGRANLARFAQVGEGLVQYGMDKTNLTLGEVQKLDEAAGDLFPEWFTVSQAEDLRAELPVGAFLLFKQALIQADLALVESGFNQAVFKKNDLMQQFKVDQGWLNIFSAEGVRGLLLVGGMPLEDYFNQLCGRGYLEEVGPNGLRIGEAAEPLAAVLGDAGLCTLSLTMVTAQGGFPLAGVFLYGGGRLFLVELKPGLMIVQQLPGLEQGQVWVKKLLAKGSQARYASYTIPPMPKPGQEPAGLTAEAAVAAGAAEQVPVQTPLGEQATQLRPRPWMLGLETGPLKGQRFPLGSQLSIGRAPDNDLVLADSQISRRHAIIERAGEGYRVTDLGSSNGTRVNGVLITRPTTLMPEDVVQVGDTRINVLGPAGTAPLAGAEPTQMKPVSAATRAYKQRLSAVPTQIAPAPAAPAVPAERKCPHCGAPLKPTSRFCAKCGKPAPLAQERPLPAAPALDAPAEAAPALYCPTCGEPVGAGENFCKNCGGRV